ncbi:MAG: BT_3044 domain-containing protein [Draconibacterium sp.]
MKQIFIYYLLLGLAFGACNSYDFEQEQYQNEINLLSNSQMIHDKQVADLSKSSDTIYLVAGLSGTQNSDKAFRVTLMEADSLFRAYNKSNFDIETERYARLLPNECYTIPSLEGQIPAGETQVKIPVYLQKLDKLSPDSIYFLDYQIDPLGTDAFNSKKKEVLLRIYKENDFSTTQRNVYYNYTSSYVTILDLNNPLVRRPTSSNQVFPLGGNSVRMMAGDEELGEYKTGYDRINQRSIVVTIGDQTSKNPLARNVTIEPYKTIDVVQMTPFEIYDNTFLINIISTPDGRATYYKEFRLHYKYRLSEADPYKEVKAILRMEYSPRADLL